MSLMPELRHTYPNLVIRNLRGNIETRLNKLANGEYDGIILAAAGIKTSKFRNAHTHTSAAMHSLPPVGQGAIAIEFRFNDYNKKIF